jgi:hypothetical protein
VKRVNGLLALIITLALTLLYASTAKAEGYDHLAYMDSVEFSLVTCSPHEEVYSLYGHTAVRYHDLHKGKEDVTFNWGVFNFEKPFFVARFVFGLTDYELGMGEFKYFCAYYRHWGSSVTEQVLNLTPEEKQKLSLALDENYQEENRVYRYNYFYDNCSTRPRDIIERCINGTIVYAPRTDYAPSFREMIRQKTAHHPWATFGNDMLLGVKADLKTTREEQEFLPENLLYDFDHAQIKGADGSWRPLVKERRMAVEPGVQIIKNDFPATPEECAWALLVVSALISIIEWRRKKTFKYWDAALMLVTGLAGCILTVMLFSQHPTTSTNLQVLLLNPVHLFYIPAVLRRKPRSLYWKLLLVMVCLFLLGGLVQQYAEGMWILAQCLLLRFCIHYRNEK